VSGHKTGGIGGKGWAMNSLKGATKWHNNTNRIFTTRFFNRWMHKAKLTDAMLLDAVEEMKRGLVDAKLGGGLFKKRLGYAGQGKRGGYRTLIASNQSNKWFFVFGFEKNQKENISEVELKALKEYAKVLLSLSDESLDLAIKKQSLNELEYDH
jgi:hypothetical protein